LFLLECFPEIPPFHVLFGFRSAFFAGTVI
jgi:hypothetical protein